jgi:hypothetical protein
MLAELGRRDIEEAPPARAPTRDAGGNAVPGRRLGPEMGYRRDSG